jgi:putative hydrolase of HD superfamily
MLGLVACAFAERFASDLDRGKIAQFAFVHDLVEVYAGDTPTAHIMTETDVSDKKAREDAALARIRSEMDPELPWVGATLEEYERLDTPEARFVKVVDKALPKITNILNSGATFKRQGHDEESGGAFLAHQHAKVRESYGSDQDAAIRLLEQAGKEMLRTIFG